MILLIRESFDYAKLMVSQLRSMKRRTPVPIFLVANKVDLERAKVIKSEGKLTGHSIVS